MCRRYILYIEQLNLQLMPGGANRQHDILCLPAVPARHVQQLFRPGMWVISLMTKNKKTVHATLACTMNWCAFHDSKKRCPASNAALLCCPGWEYCDKRQLRLQALPRWNISERDQKRMSGRLNRCLILQSSGVAEKKGYIVYDWTHSSSIPFLTGVCTWIVRAHQRNRDLHPDSAGLLLRTEPLGDIFVPTGSVSAERHNVHHLRRWHVQRSARRHLLPALQPRQRLIRRQRCLHHLRHRDVRFLRNSVLSMPGGDVLCSGPKNSVFTMHSRQRCSRQQLQLHPLRRQLLRKCNRRNLPALPGLVLLPSGVYPVRNLSAGQCVERLVVHLCAMSSRTVPERLHLSSLPGWAVQRQCGGAILRICATRVLHYQRRH